MNKVTSGEMSFTRAISELSARRGCRAYRLCWSLGWWLTVNDCGEIVPNSHQTPYQCKLLAQDVARCDWVVETVIEGEPELKALSGFGWKFAKQLALAGRVVARSGWSDRVVVRDTKIAHLREINACDTFVYNPSAEDQMANDWRLVG